MQAPSVGRIIHVFQTFTAQGTHAVLTPVPMAAIITEIPPPDRMTVSTSDGTSAVIGVTMFPGPSSGLPLAFWIPDAPGVKDWQGTYWQWPERVGG